MAGSLLPLAKQIALDNSANPGNGWKFYTYEAGTLTPKTTYQDAALTDANPNPTLANARGEVTMYGSGMYRIILKDSSDNTIWDRDNVEVGVGAGLVTIDSISLDAFVKSRVNRVVSSISALKALDKTKYTQACVTGYYAAGDGGGGLYCYDAADTTSADNGGTIIVATDGGRWKLACGNQISINIFGALPSQSSAINTTAIKAAIAACPSNGTVYAAVAGSYSIRADAVAPIVINKRMEVDFSNIKFVHDDTTTGQIFCIRKDGGTPASDLNFNGQLEYVTFKARVFGATASNGLVDQRTSVADVLALDGGTDGLNIKLEAEWFKGASLIFTGNGSVRESEFDLSARYCGYQTTNKAALHIVPVGPGGDGHNQLTFKRLRLIYSWWRQMHIVGGAATAAQKTRIVYIDDFQVEEDFASVPTWVTPPQCEQVWIEESGIGGVHFLQGNILNPYATDTAKWGHKAVRLGNAAAGYACDRVSFNRAYMQDAGAKGGIGIAAENVVHLSIGAGCGFAFSAVAQARAVVVGVTNPGDAYGTITAPAYRTYVAIDPGVDMGVAPFLPDDSYRANVVGRTGKSTASGVGVTMQNAGGYMSGKQAFVVPNGGGSYAIDLLGFLEVGASRDDLYMSTWIVNASIANYATFGVANLSLMVTCFDSNTIANVSVLNNASYSGSLALAHTTFGGAPAASLSGNNGGKFQINVTNTTGAALTLNVFGTRLGG